MDDTVLRQGKIPLRSKVWDEVAYQTLDRGIRFAVRVLHAHGVETGQSCEGGKLHSYAVPTIEFAADADDSLGFEALAHLQRYGLPVDSISIRWHIFKGLPFEKLWHITFWKKMDERADEKPDIIWGYPIVIDDTLPPNTTYMMPAEIYDLIDRAKRGELSWDYVTEEVMEAAKDGRITVITEIG